MELEDKRKLMLGVLAVLLIARFVLVPIFDWQQAQISTIEAKQQRLVKANAVVNRLPQLELALAQLQESNQVQQARYFKQSSLNAFKLQLQQQIETLFADYDMKISNFSWVVEIPGQITEARAKIAFEGSTANFARLQLAIAQSPKLLNIAQWSLHIKRMSSQSLGQARGSLLLAAYSVTPPVEAQ